MNELMETFKEILEANVEDMTHEEKIQYINNDAIPQTGSVMGLVYYLETEEIYKKHSKIIDDLLRDNEELVRGVSDILEGICINTRVWIAWEILVVNNEELINKEEGKR